MKIGIIGGTGKEGRGLALRWASKGHRVTIASRDAERGAAVAAELTALAGVVIEGGGFDAALGDTDVILVAVPYAGQADTYRQLVGRIGDRVVIDITVPLAPPRVTRVTLPPGQSAGLEARAILGDEGRLVATLHHISSAHLADLEHAIDGDILACGDDKAAMDLVLSLLTDLGARAIDAGPLANSVALESLTPVLLYLNRRYKAAGAGIRLTGLPD
jgi:NADPH-dependent F420 reductase